MGGVGGGDGTFYGCVETNKQHCCEYIQHSLFQGSCSFIYVHKYTEHYCLVAARRLNIKGVFRDEIDLTRTN